MLQTFIMPESTFGACFGCLDSVLEDGHWILNGFQNRPKALDTSSGYDACPTYPAGERQLTMI